MNKEFNEKGCLILRKFLDSRLCDSLSSVIRVMKERNRTKKGDSLVPYADAIYGIPPFDLVLDHKTRFLSEQIGLELIPTYTYARIYKKGDVLREHVDRKSCEISVTVHFGGKYEKLWPIWIESANGDKIECTQEIGDGLLYMGCERKHWRKQFDCGEDDWHAQVFMHYVKKNGKYAEWKFDKRDRLSHKPMVNDKNCTDEILIN